MNILNLLLGEITQQELLNYYNATIIYEKLPSKINGFIFYHNGTYFIIINKYLCCSKRKKTILHELAHIELSQLNQITNDLFLIKIETYEDEADKYIESVKLNFYPKKTSAPTLAINEKPKTAKFNKNRTFTEL